MSEPKLQFDVTMKHLSPDGRKASHEFPAGERAGISLKELRALLTNMNALAPKTAYPTEPEVRIVGPAGQFVIQVKDGMLRYVSWGTDIAFGGAPTVEQIVGIVSGEPTEDEFGTKTGPRDVRLDRSRHRNRAVIGALLGAFIAGLNTFTVWNAKRPPGNFLPKYRVMEPAPAQRVLTSVAGSYETGSSPGDRRLQIDKNGNVVWIKFGQNKAPLSQKQFTAQPVEAAGAQSLLTSRKSLIKIKDLTSLSLFGDTYVRTMN
jgi:hypothetical protein